MRISAVIAAKNEAKTVAEIVRETSGYVDEVLVIDGHSSDHTARLAEAAGARVYADNRKGKGDAIRKGIEEAKGEIIVFLDADGSHAPADIPALVAPIRAGVCEHVTGSRMITLGINYRFDVRLTDSQNGFRAILSEVARDLKLQEDITTIEQEMIIKTLRKGYRIAEIPAHEYKRIHGESRIRISQVACRYVYSWLKYLFF